MSAVDDARNAYLGSLNNPAIDAAERRRLADTYADLTLKETDVEAQPDIVEPDETVDDFMAGGDDEETTEPDLKAVEDPWRAPKHTVEIKLEVSLAGKTQKESSEFAISHAVYDDPERFAAACAEVAHRDGLTAGRKLISSLVSSAAQLAIKFEE